MFLCKGSVRLSLLATPSTRGAFGLLATGLLMTAAGCAFGQPGPPIAQPPAFTAQTGNALASAIVPAAIDAHAMLVIRVDRASRYRLKDVSGLSFDRVRLTLDNPSLLGAGGQLSQTVAVTGDQTTLTAAFTRLKPGAGYRLSAYLMAGDRVVGSVASGGLTLAAGMNAVPLDVEKQAASLAFGPVATGANAAGNRTAGTDVVLGDSVALATGIPTTTSSGIARIQAFLAPPAVPVPGETPAVAGEAAIGPAISDPARFGHFDWRTAEAVDYDVTAAAWTYAGLAPASLVGGALLGAAPARGRLYFKLWDRDGLLLGVTAALDVQVYQPGVIHVTLR